MDELTLVIIGLLISAVGCGLYAGYLAVKQDRKKIKWKKHTVYSIRPKMKTKEEIIKEILED